MTDGPLQVTLRQLALARWASTSAQDELHRTKAKKEAKELAAALSRIGMDFNTINVMVEEAYKELRNELETDAIRVLLLEGTSANTTDETLKMSSGIMARNLRIEIEAKMPKAEVAACFAKAAERIEKDDVPEEARAICGTTDSDGAVISARAADLSDIKSYEETCNIRRAWLADIKGPSTLAIMHSAMMHMKALYDNWEALSNSDFDDGFFLMIGPRAAFLTYNEGDAGNGQAFATVHAEIKPLQLADGVYAPQDVENEKRSLDDLIPVDGREPTIIMRATTAFERELRDTMDDLETFVLPRVAEAFEDDLLAMTAHQKAKAIIDILREALPDYQLN